MRDAGVLPSGRVRSVTVRPLRDGGTGFSGDTVRVELEYEDAPDAPPTVIAKFPTSDRSTRGMLEAFDAYAREIRFYQKYAHRMPCPTPAYFGADYDKKGAKETGPRLSRLIDALPDRVQLRVTADVTKFMRASKRRYALLIEDLGADTTVYDMASPPDDGQLAAALEELAALHAAFWHDDGLHGDDVFREMLTTTPGLYQTVGRKRCLPLAQERWADWLTVADVAALREALDRFPEDVARVNQKITMIHGDPRSDNLLFGADGRVVILDWSLAGHAHPGYDVAYLLSSCLGPERIGARHELIERYEGALASNGVEIDGADLRATVAAAYRGMAVQQLMSIAVLNNESYGDDSMYDLWMPRILVGLAVEW
jgi:hypothetical protein